MIESFKASNFKSLTEGSSDLKIKPITILIGPNSSGKSSYLQILLMIKQTLDSRDRLSALISNSSYVQLGGFSDFIFEHKVKAPLEIEMEFPSIRRISSVIKKRIGNDVPNIDIRNNVIYRISFKQSSKLQLFVNYIELFIGEQNIFRLCHSGRGMYNFSSPYSDLIGQPSKSKWYQAGKFYNLSKFLMSIIQDDKPGLFDLIRLCETALENSFARLYYIGPLREYPRRFYVARGERPQDVGMRGENSVELLISSSQLNKVDNLTQSLNIWLNKFGMAARLVLERIKGSQHYYIKVDNPNSGVRAHIADVGFGVSQVLPLMIETFFTRPGSTIIMEQPEIHLHPRVQAEFADMIVSNCKGKQFIIETHSEHIVTRLQRRIADRTIDKEDVMVYFCSMTDAGTKLKELKIDEYGSFDEWPEGLFGDELEDHYQILMAKAKRVGVGLTSEGGCKI